MVLYELHENAMHYMERDEWSKSLILLQKAQIIIEVGILLKIRVPYKQIWLVFCSKLT